MADRSTERRWLDQLTRIPTAPGREQRVMSWVTAWAGRREDLRSKTDLHGNLLLTRRGRKRRQPVLAVAHTDHPAFVVTGVEGPMVSVEFRGGVRKEYFRRTRIELFDSSDGVHLGDLEEFDHEASRGVVRLDRPAALMAGDVGRWFFGTNRGGAGERFLLAPACDDLAGVAAALAALDRARSTEERRHFGVLLTRAEEVGFVGAIGACRAGTAPEGSRIISVECSRAYDDSPLGGGPVIRVGDASSVFDHGITNRLAEAATQRGVRHQRRLMAGGSCEATAFVAYGYRAGGVCLPMGNYHNMGHLDQVEQGKGIPTLLPEVVSLDDFHGLVDLLGLAAESIDGPSSLRARIDDRFERWGGLIQ